jgi:hypothetical protein
MYIHIHKFCNLIYRTYPFLTFIYEFLLLAKLNCDLVHMVILCVNKFIYRLSHRKTATLYMFVYWYFLEGKMLHKHRLFSQTLKNCVVMFTIGCDMVTELCGHVYHKVRHALATHRWGCLGMAHVAFCMLSLFLHLRAAPSMMHCKS